MERIEGQTSDSEELAKQVISWITCAKRPLTTSELQHALAVELEEPELDKENLCQIEEMVSVCAGLVTVDEESRIIRLVHYTTQEYFEQTKTRWFPNIHIDIAITCTRYLSFNEFESGPSQNNEDLRKRLKLNPFYHYASHNWGHHAREASERIPEVINFLKRDLSVEASSQILLAPTWESQYFPRQMKGIHLATYFGIEKTVQHLFSHGSTDLTDSYGRTPLSYAAEYGHEAMVKLLLEHGVKPDSKDAGYGRTPLSWAARNRFDAIVRLLLEQGAEPDSKDDKYGRTPLALAAQNGHEIVAKLLLATDSVNVNSKDDECGDAPLSLAAWNGHTAVVKLLLATEGVDINLQSNDGRTSLALAARYGHEAVVKLLLSTDSVDVDLKDNKYGRTPLSLAAENGHEEVVKLLLAEDGVDPNSKDKDGHTPWALAAWNGHKEVVKLLATPDGVDLNSKEDGGHKP